MVRHGQSVYPAHLVYSQTWLDGAEVCAGNLPVVLVSYALP